MKFYRNVWPFCRDCKVDQTPETVDPPECITQTGALIPLCMALPGEDVELIDIDGCPRVRKRLGDLGLNIGMNVRVIHCNGGGPMILAVKDDCRLGIGRGLASKIIVKTRSGV